MSAFMVSNECMNNVINGLFWNHQFKDWNSEIYKEQNLNDSEDFEELAIRLFTLNQSALIQRYPNEKADSDYIQIPKFEWKGKTCNIYQTLKSLHCLHYQCSEGEIPEEPLYKWLDKVISALESYIINRLSEYEKAKWD